MRTFVAVGLCMWLWSGHATAQETPLRYNTYGAPGLIDMPAASSAPDAELAFSVSTFAGQTRTTATFQVSPRLSASFRYAELNDLREQGGVTYDTILDRSLGLHYRILDETARSPAVAVGVSDFIGTGIYASEYIVATKQLRPHLAATLGIGWGRLAGLGAFPNPLGDRFATRPAPDIGQGGTVSGNPFFRGDAALFGGVHWQPDRRWGVTLEYASDAYPFEDGSAFVRRSPLNIGLTYAPRPNLRLSAHALYGSEIGAQLTYVLNPLQPPHGSGYDRGPPPIRPRAAGRYPQSVSQSALANALAQEGLILRGLDRTGNTVSIVVENTSYIAAAQAVGRAARVLSDRAPTEVMTFAISLSEHGLTSPAIILPRDTLETAEFAPDGAAMIRAAATVDRHPLRTLPIARDPALQWRIGPYITPNLFDPDDPLRADIGIAFDSMWEPAPGLVVRGTLRQRVVGNLDETTRESDSVLPRVRSDFRLYDQEGDADLVDLTLSWYAQPAPTVTTRLSIGLFETMFAGASAEILWRPADSDLAFGLELNSLRQRDYDGGFGLRDYQVNSGHASAYWQIGHGYEAQLDLGRYLAGDWGGTLHLSRRFANGWSLGAFATLTDVPFDTFGEGSFDKGVTMTIPLGWISGQARRDTLDATLRPVTRDGGARVMIEGRLYDLTRPQTADAINDSWGRFWR